jgi:hypothetical protein
MALDLRLNVEAGQFSHHDGRIKKLITGDLV